MRGVRGTGIEAGGTRSGSSSTATANGSTAPSATHRSSAAPAPTARTITAGVPDPIPFEDHQELAPADVPLVDPPPLGSQRPSQDRVRRSGLGGRLQPGQALLEVRPDHLVHRVHHAMTSPTRPFCSPRICQPTSVPVPSSP